MSITVRGVIGSQVPPGWAAIDAAVGRLYPGVRPLVVGTPQWDVHGGPDPLQRISLYRRPDHWHLITYGMSELYRKVSSVPDESGWGFEFTMRVPVSPVDPAPPDWAIDLMRMLAGMVFALNDGFTVGSHLDWRGPISMGRVATPQTSLVFVGDPELPPIGTPFGRLAFLQVFGLWPEEQHVLEGWDPVQVIEAFRHVVPWFVTDLHRPNLLDDERLYRYIRDRAIREGSSTASIGVLGLGYRIEQGMFVLSVSALEAPKLNRAIAGRLPYGRELTLNATVPNGGLVLRRGDSLTMDGRHGAGLPDLYLPAAVTLEMSPILDAARAGSYRLQQAGNMVLEIVPTRFRDAEGIVREVG